VIWVDLVVVVVVIGAAIRDGGGDEYEVVLWWVELVTVGSSEPQAVSIVAQASRVIADSTWRVFRMVMAMLRSWRCER
jgi:hypothetical protein